MGPLRKHKQRRRPPPPPQSIPTAAARRESLMQDSWFGATAAAAMKAVAAAGGRQRRPHSKTLVRIEKRIHDPNSVWHFRPLKRASTQDPSLLACSCVGLGSKFKTTTRALIKGLSHANINEFQAPLSVTVRSF